MTTLNKLVTIPRGSTGERVYYANFLYSGREDITLTPAIDEDKIWTYKSDLYIRTTKSGIVKIYAPDETLRRLHTILTAGESKLKLPSGIYIVTLNNSPGQKVLVE